MAQQQSLVLLKETQGQYWLGTEWVDCWLLLRPNHILEVLSQDLIDQTYDLVRLADAAIVTSGTATLETALLKTPQIVCYKTSPLSFAIAKRIVKLPFISLVNLVLNRLLVHELIQSECNQSELTNSLREILSNNGRKSILSGYDELIKKLGGKGASEKVAMLINKRTNE